MKPLSLLKPGERGYIAQLKEGLLSLKLLDMGVTPGESVKVIKIAPFGDPMYLEIGRSYLSIRKEEASAVLVKEQAPGLVNL